MANIFGTSGDDWITPDSVSSGVTGGTPSAADDRIEGNEGDDTLDGGGGNDTLIGQGGDDVIEGGDGRDALNGYAGDDTLDGGDGDDRLYGGSGRDRLTGGSGEDTFGFAYGVDDTITDFEDGIDVIRLKGYGIGGIGDLTVGQEGANTVIALPDACGTITLENFAIADLDAGDFDIVGAAGPLSLCLNGSMGADMLTGDAGNDKLVGYGGADTLDGGAGNDAVHGYAGDDILIGGAGNDQMWGGSGEDTVVGDILGDEGDPDTIDLIAEAGTGQTGDPPPPASNGEQVSAYNDLVEGGSGGASDVLVGDVLDDRASGEVMLTASAGIGGDGTESGDGAPGGDNNSVTAFNDAVYGGTGNDVLVGDVCSVGENATAALIASSGSAGPGVVDYVGGGDGGDSNAAVAFNDTLSGGAGNDTLVGDVACAGARATIMLHGSVGSGGPSYYASSGSGGDHNAVGSFNDEILGGEGDDTLVGDVSNVGSSAKITFDATDSLDILRGALGPAGGYNSIVAFNDQITGGIGKDVLVGDVLSIGIEAQVALNANCGSGGDYFGGPGRPGGNNNTVHAFSDALYGGAGNDHSVGDVFCAGDDGTTELIATAGVGGVSGYVTPGGDGGDNNAAIAFSDTLTGEIGDDTLVGDVHGVGHSATMRLSVDVGSGGKGGAFRTGSDGGWDNRVSAFNDTLSAGPGNDFLVGDVLGASEEGTLELMASASRGGRGSSFDTGGSGGKGGDNNDIAAFNDTLEAGAGDDTLVGDVYANGNKVVELKANAGEVGAPGYLSSGGAGGSGNAISAFNDSLLGGDGDDTSVGDVYANGNKVVELKANAGEVGAPGYFSSGGAGGSDNAISAFNDDLDGGAGNDLIVGDVYVKNGSSSVALSATVGSGGDQDEYGTGSSGGDSNTGSCFNDVLEGGGNEDTLVGDVWSDGSGEIVLNVVAGADGEGTDRGVGGSGGVGNEVTAFNDALDGGDGDDLLVGDVCYTGVGGTVTVTVEGTAGNTVSAFQDTLTGGEGADTLFGDFFDGTGAFTPEVTVDGDFDGRDDLFADILDGSDGDDLIVGGLGSDTLTGGGGADTFGLSAADTVFGGGDDVITDFQVSGADVIALTGYGIDFADLVCTQDGDDAEISGFGGGTITLVDFDCTDLDNADFVFG